MKKKFIKKGMNQKGQAALMAQFRMGTPIDSCTAQGSALVALRCLN